MSHPHPFDPTTITDILASLAALGATWTRFPRFVALRLTMAATAAANANRAAGAHPLPAARDAVDAPAPSSSPARSHALDLWSHQQLSLTLRCLHSCFALPVDDATLTAVGGAMARQLAAMEPAEGRGVMARELARPPSTTAWALAHQA